MVTIAKAVEDGLPIDIDELRESLDDPIGWAQEYMCEFLDSSNVLLPYDLIATAESASATVSCDPAIYLGNKLDLRLGIDFGRTNDPTVCWTLERVGDVLVTREVLVLRNMSVPDQMEVLRHRIKAARRVCYDYTGVGIGMGDVLVKEFGRWHPEGHEFGKIELCTFTTAFKRLIFPRLRQAFESPCRVRIRSTWRCARTCTPCSRSLEARITPTRPLTPERATPTAARPWLWPCAPPTATCNTTSRLQAAAASSRVPACLAAAPTALSLAAVPPSTA